MQIDYVIKKSHRRSMSLLVDSDGKVIVKAPVGTPAYVAEEFIRERRDWIVNQLTKIENQTRLAEQLGYLSAQDIKNLKKRAKEEDALAFIEQVKKKYPDAKHHVYAYVLREGHKSRYSDDREPKGTAGIPVLEVVQKQNELLRLTRKKLSIENFEIIEFARF